MKGLTEGGLGSTGTEGQVGMAGGCLGSLYSGEERSEAGLLSCLFCNTCSGDCAGVTGGLCSGDCAGVTGGLSSTGGGVEGRICGDSWAEAGAGVVSSSDLVELPSLVSEPGSEPGKREKREEGSGSNRLSSPTASTGF